MRKSILLLLTCFFFSVLVQGQIITTIAGVGAAGFGGDNGPATSATLNSPHDVVFWSGSVFFSDENNHRIRKIDALGNITTVAGNGTAGFAGDNNPATSAELNFPTGLAFDRAGNLYIADQDNYRIRKVTPAGIISTVAGNGVFTYTGDGVQATAAGLFPTGVGVDTFGNLYIAEQANYRIREVNLSGVISTVVGTGTGGYSGDGGPATDAQIGPIGVYVDNSENIYIADVYNNRIRIVNSAGIINTFAGNGSAAYSGDSGLATAASLQAPQCVRTDNLGNVYIADNFNARIRMVNTAGIIYTVAGYETSGFTGDNGPATDAELNGPSGVVVDSSGRIFIADNLNNRVRKVAPPDLQPIVGATSICPDTTLSLTNSTSGGSWSSSSTSIATVNAASGQVRGIAPGTVTITYSIYDSSVSATVTILPWSECPSAVANLNIPGGNGLKIYPNPNSGSFSLKFASFDMAVAHIIITDVLGRKLEETDCPANTPIKVQLPVAPGIYYYSAMWATGNQTGAIEITE